MYGSYYTATLERSMIWFVTGALRNENGLAFDRALDASHDLFEFFVPQDQEAAFINFIAYFVDHGFVRNLQKLPNRVEIEQAQCHSLTE